MQFQPKTDWTAPNLADLPSWAGAKRVAVDIETKDLQLRSLGIGVRRGGYIVGVSFAIEDGPAFYLPIAHGGGGNMDKEGVLSYLREQARTFKGAIVGAGLQYDLDYLAEAGVWFGAASFFRDVQVAEPLLDELQMSYSLQNIAGRHGLPGKSEAHLQAAAEAFGVDPKGGLWQLPAKHVGAYAEQDARLPLTLIRRQERRLEDEELFRVYDLESKLLPVLVKMRRRGVAVDFDRLDEVEKWSVEKEVEALAELTRLTGVSLSPSDTNRTKVLAPLLTGIGITLPRTDPTEKFPKGQESMKTKFLQTIDHPIAKMIVRARKFNKLRNTFVESIRDYAVKGRIHCTFNQLRSEKPGADEGDDENGARYGRLSCVDPNLQQQPSKDKEIAPKWRSIYRPDLEYWGCQDYSQQEPRWFTHLAALSKCTGAAAMRDAYIQDPNLDNHTMMQKIVGWEGKDGRDRAKIIYLGLCYGMGGAKLAHSIGKPTKWIPHWKDPSRLIEVAGEEAQAILDRFNLKVPFVKEMSEKASAVARARGYIRTVMGRKCRFPRGPDGKFMFLHKAGNRAVQGSSGDQTKAAMVEADAQGFEMQLQVHDELDQSFSSREQAEALAKIMREAVPCTVPMKVDIEMGPSWGECK